jgi:hypothetical protein
MQILAIILGLAIFGVFYLPVYLPFLISFKIKSPDYREIRWALRITSAPSFFLALTPPPGLRHNFGDDVGGNIAGVVHNFPIMFAWVWGGGLACLACCLIIGFIVRAVRRRGAPSLPGQAAE